MNIPLMEEPANKYGAVHRDFDKVVKRHKHGEPNIALNTIQSDHMRKKMDKVKARIKVAETKRAGKLPKTEK
jgi:hypothetical protein